MGVCGSGSINDNESPTKENAEKYIEQKYEKGDTLGKGGSCKVVVCTERATSQKFALKIMQAREKINKELFEKEKDVLQKLSHQNIIQFKESHIDSLNYYIVTTLCEGGELFDRIVDKANPITEKRASELIRTMLEAIRHCHQKNIVHRDIKPENFVFKTKAQDSEMVLIDFGCAKIVEDETAYADLVGTPYYLAPESAVGHKYKRTGKVLKSSDLWAIGVIAYVCMTGRPPFNGHTNRDIFTAIIKKPLKFPQSVELSESFTDFCIKILKKSPKRRLVLEDALKHPWVLGQEASDKKIPDDVIRVLRQFNQQSKLKKAITKVLASNMGNEPKIKIQEHFKKLDKNNDGSLDLNELTQLLMQMGFPADEAQRDAEKIMEDTDTDNNGSIDFNEFAQIWQRKLLTVNENYIDAVFKVLDEDNNGQIEAAELAKVLGMEGKQNEEEIKSYIREVDSDGDGQLSYQEFKNAMLEKCDLRTGPVVGFELQAEDIEDIERFEYGVDIDAEGVEGY